jgi:hypothetical protein
MKPKNFRLKPEQIIDLIPAMGGCFATDRITVDGKKVGYMYREEAEEELDSGWRFFEGSESDEYVNDQNNIMIYAINTIANYDPAIIPYLDLPYGTELERIEGTDEFNILPH